MEQNLRNKIEDAQRFHQKGQLDLARKAYKKILEKYPQDFNSMNLLGTLEIQCGNFRLATFLLSKAITINPNIASCYNNLSIALIELEELEGALERLDEAIYLDPNLVDAYNNKANILFKLKKYDEALINYNKAIKINSKYFKAYNNKGNVLFEQARYKEAIKCFEKAISINPEYINAINNLGNSFQELSDYKNAILKYKEAILIDPNSEDSLNNYGKTLTILNHYDDAKKIFDDVISINSKNDISHYNLAKLFLKFQKFDDAIKYFNNAIALNPNSKENYIELGNIYLKLNRFDQALENYRKSLILNEVSPQIYNSLGNTYYNLNQIDSAIEHYKKAISLDEKYVLAYINLGNLYKKIKKLKDSIICHEKALSLNSKSEFLFGTLFNTKMMICDWSSFDYNIKIIEKSILRKEKIIRPFASLSIFDNPKLHKLVAKNFSDHNFPDLNFKYSPQLKVKSLKIRVGYYSSDFNENHPVSHLLSELFEKHNKDEFEIYAFSLTKTNFADKIRRKFTLDFDYFFDVENKSDLEIVELSRSLNLDIAIDLNGHTQNSRTIIFSHKVAPIQINFLGYPGTMGSNYYDYILTDKTVLPPENKKHFFEKLIYLPDCYLINPSIRQVSNEEHSKSSFGLPEESFVFCCFNNSYKIMPSIFVSWINIIKNIKNSVLWLAETNMEAKKNLLNMASSLGIGPKRIIFAKRELLIEDHLVRYKMVDLFLDTFPFNGHTTACDALYLGVPLLTITGNSLASRVGASLLTNLNIKELITYNDIDYEEKAIFLANNPNILNMIKDKILKNKEIKPLFNSKLSTISLEKAYKKIHLKYKSGIIPHSFEVE